MTIRNGRRCSAAVAYLRPALKRRNVVIETRALATRILFDGTRAIGIEYAKNGNLLAARAGSEVILCAGVINSPQLLMLSGIGDPAALGPLGIRTLVGLPGVGRNLQDHMSAALFYKRKEPGPLHARMRLDRIAYDVGNAYFFGRGIANDLPAGCMAFLRTEASEQIPDVQFLFNAAPLAAKPYLSPFVKPYADGFASRVAGLRPESRGRVTLASADPAAAPRIHQNFFAVEKDLVTIRKAVRMAREVARQPALRPFLDRDVTPGLSESDASIDAYIRSTAITAHHPLGTCRMGPDRDPSTVLGGDLKVRGVEGLRVIDASAMPDLVGGNINAPVIMIAERAADLILGKAPLEPARSTIGATQ
jgi:4-pyridoxate dehydrogenase